MVRDYIVKAACLLMLIGFAAGIIAQIEVMKPRIAFMDKPVWLQLIAFHAWTTATSLVAIFLSTISFIRHKDTLGQWAVWLGLCTVPVLFGVLLQLAHMSAGPEDYYLPASTVPIASRHAYGTAVLLAALGGLSAMTKMRTAKLSIKTSFGFAFFITISGVAYVVLQAAMGLNGLPRRQIEYPYAFDQLQLYSSIAAIVCFSLSTIYVLLLWRSSDKGRENWRSFLNDIRLRP